MQMKYIYRIIVLALTLALSLVPAVAMASSAQVQDNLKAEVFLDAPAKGLAAIYKDYHDWKVSSGIDSALSAILQIDTLSPETVLEDKGLRLNRANQIKSTLHTLLGMLYYRKALLVQRDGKDGAVSELMGKVKSGAQITEADLEKVALEAENGQTADAKKNSLVAMAVNEFVSASMADPNNPSPHYQLAQVYSALQPQGLGSKAEQEYFAAAELSFKEGSREDAIKVLATIREMNPNSEYASRLEAMVAK